MHTHSRLVAVEEQSILGWAALSPTSNRAVYAGVAEVSVYVNSTAQGKGVGKRLMASLIAESEKNNIWMLQASIFPENQASLKLHYHYGFTKLGVREKIAQLHGVWRDTVIVQRRSKLVGID